MVTRVVDSHESVTGTESPRVTASASSYLMRGRRIQLRQVESVTLPNWLSGNCRSRNVFTPSSVPANLSVMYRFMPWTMDTTAIRNITPMNTPTTENALFSFCDRRVWIARRTASKKRMAGGYSYRRASTGSSRAALLAG